ncbi:MAG TPA: HD domain-containing phosphohydrolase [Solirubrobacteraceae bacterium]|nr:HD domain-containing phosphohydrolase [Solirubrobacteraceae bacterium]
MIDTQTPRGQSGADLLRLEHVAGAPASRGIAAALAAAREVLGMDIAYLSEFGAGSQQVRDTDGPADVFNLQQGTSVPLEQSYCRRMVEGAIPNAIPDARAHPVLGELEVTEEAGIGSYIGVPVRLRDGQFYGTLCCVSRETHPLTRSDVAFMHILARLAAGQIDYDEERRQHQRIQVEASALQALVAALDAHESYMAGHSLAVVELSMAVARELELSEQEVTEVGQVALLHDIGKLGIPDSILSKAGPLDEREEAIMRRHPAIAEQLVSSIDGLAHLAPALRAEHERWDGGGYPDGLAGEEIPLPSAICLACDAYHAMTSDRPYRRSLGHEQALAELRRNAGSQFRPEVVDALLAVLGRTKSKADG